MSLLALDIGGTFIKWASAEGYQLCEKGKVPTPRKSLDDFTACIDELFHAGKYDGIAISLPGTIDPDTGMISQGGALQYNNNVNMIEFLGSRYHVPVSIENDARCAALAEAENGALKDEEFGLVIVVGTGIGSALVHKGEILRGSHIYAGELSMALCGSAQDFGFSLLFGNQCGMEGFTQIFRNQLSDPSLTGESFMAMVESGHEEASALFESYCRKFAGVLFTLQFAYDPGTIVIGGGISANPLFIEGIQKQFEQLFSVFPFKVRHAEITASRQGNDANLSGALANYYRRHC